MDMIQPTALSFYCLDFLAIRKEGALEFSDRMSPFYLKLLLEEYIIIANRGELRNLRLH